ncbi:uncharacterized protein LOC115563269 [Drosophila navojoa]|uniref:uncharacterized protein LOC115563269 n=1 Tax=Drosophila navojoa TaxID=7232 RepID=UPI0011BEEF70|nr:uncharacterized protein LOC115563269 [Drosophila navojoa]
MRFPFAILLLAAHTLAADVSRFTNIECESLDPSRLTFQQCNLKMLGRGIVGLNIYATLINKPWDNMKVSISLWRKYNGYHPFLVNSTFDLCKLMAKPTQKMSFAKLFMSYMSESSNFNHSCPYENELIVRNMIFKEEYLKFAPLPHGHYKFQFMSATNNEWKSIINAHILHVSS